jgi:hypothetical protein
VKSLSISSILAIVIMGFSGLANAWITTHSTISEMSVDESGVTIIGYADGSPHCYIESSNSDLIDYAQYLYVTQITVKAECHEPEVKPVGTNTPLHKLHKLFSKQ